MLYCPFFLFQLFPLSISSLLSLFTILHSPSSFFHSSCKSLFILSFLIFYRQQEVLHSPLIFCNCILYCLFVNFQTSLSFLLHIFFVKFHSPLNSVYSFHFLFSVFHCSLIILHFPFPIPRFNFSFTNLNAPVPMINKNEQEA